MGELDDYLVATLRSAPELGQSPWAAVPVAQHSARSGNVVQNAQAMGHTTNMAAHHVAARRIKDDHGNIFERALHWVTRNQSVARAAVNAVVPAAGAVAAVTPKPVRDAAVNTLDVTREGGVKQGALYAATQGPTLASAATGTNANLTAQMNTLQGAPLREVQHQYRALRYIYERNGVRDGLIETGLLSLGGAAGAWAAGKPGGVLGAEAALGVSERALHKDAWDATANGEAYRDGRGRAVSPGRDVARLLGLRDGTAPFGALSAVGDGLFDLTADPLAAGAGIAHGFNATENAAGGKLGRWRGDTVLRSADDVDRLLTQRPKATSELFGDLANKQAAEVARDYPMFESVAKDLGDAASPDEVAQVFRDALQGPEFLGDGIPTGLQNRWLPKASTTPAAMTPLSAAIEDGPVGRLMATKRRLTTKIPMALDPETLNFSAKAIDPARDNSFGAVRAALKFGRLSERVIDGIMNDYINAVDTGQRRLIFRNAMVRSALSMGIDDDSQIVARLRQEVTDAMGGVSGAEGAHYGYGVDGKDLSMLPTDHGGQTTAAIYRNQRGDLALPDFAAWTRAMREAQGAKALYGRLDDWAFHSVTRPFKALNLLTGGFALRVATAELIPAVLRNGVLDTVRATAAQRAAVYGERLADDEIGHIQAAVAKVLRGPAGFLASDEDVRLATENVQFLGGHTVAPAVRAGDFITNDAVGKAAQAEHNIYALAHDAPTFREGNTFAAIRGGEKDQPLYWQRALREASGDEGAQLHAKAYADTYDTVLRSHVQTPFDPASLPPAESYHGTSQPFEGGKLRGKYDYGNSESAKNIYGRGVYTTDSGETALGYTRKGRGNEPTIYGIKWNGDKPPNLIDFDAPPPPAVRQMLQEHVSQLLESSLADEMTAEHAAELQRIVGDESAPISRMYDAVREGYSQAHLPISEVDEALDDLNSGLETLGYDGIKHIGGQRTGNAAHNVRVYFDPAKLNVEHATNAAPAARAATEAEAVAEATREAMRVDEQWLRSLPESELSDFTRSVRGPHPDADPILEFARTRVEATKGLTHAPRLGEDGEVIAKPHLHLLDDIAAGKHTPLKTLEGIEAVDRPYSVKGRVRVPDIGGNKIDRLANWGFHKVLDPTINTLGREHQYFLSVKKAFRTYEPMIEAGQIGRDEALMHANIDAIKDVSRFIHNPAERSQFSVLARNIAPFWFAQEQSYRRAGRLLATNPAAFRRYQLMASAFADYVHEQHDKQGMAHFVIPALGFLDETAVGAMAAHGLPVAGAVPTQVLGNVDSLQTLFPFAEGEGNPLNPQAYRPSWSVFVTLPAHLVENFFPEARPTVTTLIGEPANAGSVWDTLMPSTPARNLVKAFSNGPTIASSMVTTFQSLAYQQNVAMEKWIAAGHSPDAKGAPRIVPPPNAGPHERKMFMEKVRNQARVQQVFRAIFSAVSPAAPTIDVGNYGLKQVIQTYIDKYGYFEGTQRYLEKNPNATPYTITQSESPDGAALPAPVAAAQRFIDKHIDLFDKYPAAAGYLVPQDTKGKFDSAAYQQQIALGLRQRKGFDKFAEDFYVNEGFAQYDQDLKTHQQAVADAGDNPDAIAAENASWSDYLHNALAKQNTVWWDYFTSSDRENRRTNELDQLRKLVATRSVARTKMGQGIAGLLRDLDAHLAALAGGRLDGWTTEERQSELDSWQAYLDATAVQQPHLALVIRRLFSHEGV